MMTQYTILRMFHIPSNIIMKDVCLTPARLDGSVGQIPKKHDRRVVKKVLPDVSEEFNHVVLKIFSNGKCNFAYLIKYVVHDSVQIPFHHLEIAVREEYLIHLAS